MGNFNKFDNGHGKGFGGGGHFSGGRGFGGRNDGPKQMYPATCSKCGQSCEVPFKPTGERPVFCNNCFKSQGGGSVSKFAPRSFGGGNRGGANTGAISTGAVSKTQLDSLNAKLDRILSLLIATETKKAPDVIAPKEKSKKEVVKKIKTPVKKSKGKKK